MNLDGADELSSVQRGDFQTPAELARLIWSSIAPRKFDYIIEPTFGLGTFLETLPEDYEADILGWEIHDEYYAATLNKIAGLKSKHIFKLFRGDIFDVAENDIILTPTSSVLVVGNPPWVTNSEQGSLGGANTGKKRNLKSLTGLDAITGKSNFDISEGIILHLIGLLRGRCKFAQFALLTKFSVLRNLIQYLQQYSDIGNFEFHRINTSKHFGASVDAGLVKFQLNRGSLTRGRCPILSGIDGDVIGEIGIVENRLIYDLNAYERNAFMEHKGERHYTWRQGLKHDLSRIMELFETSRGLMNGLGEIVDIEIEPLYYLYKSSDLFHGRVPRFLVPIYQRDLKDSLKDLNNLYPKLYSYLKNHEAEFRARKSSIYKNRHVFSLFGVGDYTHSPFKIGIGALYSEPVFRLLDSTKHPAVVDDTGYMLPTTSYEEAIYLFAVLSLECTREFLLSISHSSDKRRFSKNVLSRVLIPPMQECPSNVLEAISRSWDCKQEFDETARTKLRGWLAKYSPKGNQDLSEPAIASNLIKFN